MGNYADYGFYINEFNGSLSEDLFSLYIVKASREIDNNTNRKLTYDVINSLGEDGQYKIKYTACELCDYFNAYGSNSSYGKAETIIIDGVHINRQNKNATDLKEMKRDIIKNLPQELTRYL